MSRLARIFTFGGMDDKLNRWRRLVGMSFGLVYLFYPISDIVGGKVTGSAAVWQSVALASFVVTYVLTVLSPRGYEEKSRWTLPLLGLTTVMAAVYPLLFSGGWLALPIYTTVVYAMALPPRGALAGIGGMAAIVLIDGQVTNADGGAISMLLLQVVTLGVLFVSVRNTRVLIVKLRNAQSEVARLAANEERLRIARDLHDLLGHSLSLIVLKSELARRLAEQGSERAAQEVADIESVARQALVEVREAVTGYRQRSLTDEIDGARAALAAAGVEVTVRTAGTPLPDDLDGLFGWAVREAATNVIRHARATRCEINLTYGEAGAVLEVADNGKAGPYQPGSGLTGLTERVGTAGGSVEAAPMPAGFRLRVVVPRRPVERKPDQAAV
ncbi:sensor histidine kinase [Planotetraspora sp. A-T 1434]|uniref:sensor histidine kinase n=1 Tax=Planotetraspora sp. A-T 1434 TaxID=2979219 RepID=UPI0021C1533A|nr:sensor histidine kinase [Planotetraspora sp. A-T 1434]MCT9932770.1 sensor histidine kinase [Planotetraspora sp. A-T 1434]